MQKYIEWLRVLNTDVATFDKFSSRSFSLYSFNTVGWETLVCHFSHDESSVECHCRSYCQLKQLLISLQMSGFKGPESVVVVGTTIATVTLQPCGGCWTSLVLAVLGGLK